MTAPKTNKPKKTTTKATKPKKSSAQKPKKTPGGIKPVSTQVTTNVNDVSPMIQSLRESVQMQARIIAEQKKQLINSGCKQVQLAKKHSEQIKALTQKQNTRVAEIKKVAQQKNDSIKAETSLRLTEKKGMYRKQIDDLTLLKKRTVEEANIVHAKKLEKCRSALRERLQEQSALYDEKASKLISKQKTIVDKLKKNSSEKLAELKETSEQQILQANKEIASLQQVISTFKDTDKDKTIKQLRNSRKFLQDKTVDLKTSEQQILTVQNFVHGKHSETSSAFSLEWFILKLLSVGYHRYARIHYLDLVTENDWKNLLSDFQSTSTGFDKLETMRPLFLPWIQYYHALIDVIHDQGYTVRPMEDYLENGHKKKSVYMYHDVHAWDIIPALGMALANKDRGICTTFLLNIDQAHIDLSHEAGYRIFGTISGQNVRPGLHCNPFATWVRMDIFKGDEKAFMSWVRSEGSAEELKSLLTDEPNPSGAFSKVTKKSAMDGTMDQLNKCFQKLRTFAPKASSASHHGDILNTLFPTTNFNNVLDSDFAHTPSLLRGKSMKICGIKISPTAVQENHSGTIDIYSEMPNKANYFENLHKALGLGQSMLLINHPGAISNSGLSMNLGFVDNLNNSKYKEYQPVSTPLQSPTQMLASNNYIYNAED